MDNNQLYSNQHVKTLNIPTCVKTVKLENKYLEVSRPQVIGIQVYLLYNAQAQSLQ